jgi:ATP-dependent 26S proteasome regulatory subunit
MLAKAVAHHTSASFIAVVGSEFVQKYLGEGPRMVRYAFTVTTTFIFITFAALLSSPLFSFMKPC